MKKTLIYFLLLGSFSFSCKKKAESKKEAEEVLSVKTETVTSKPLSEPIVASGVLASKSEMKLAFKTGGMIRRMYVQEGQFVKAGQLLAELDLSEIDAQVKQSKLGLEKSSRDLERVKKLYADEATTLTNVQDATTGYEAAKQTVQVAEFNQKLSKIYAPSNGKILRKVSEQGELVTPFAPVLILGSVESASIVKIGVSDKAIVKIKMGDVAKVYLDAYPNEVFQAHVTQIAQTVNPATGTFEVELQMQPNGKKLISGFVAKAEIQSAANNYIGLTIPVEALVEGDKGKGFVYELLDNSTVKRIPITFGEIYGSEIAVLSGINEGTKIVTKGANFLSDGSKVKLVN